MLQVLALTRYGRIGASSRVRFYQYISAFQGLGINVHISPLLRNAYLGRLYAHQPTKWSSVACYYLYRALTLLSATKYDLLWIEKELFPDLPAWCEQAIDALGLRYIVEYDDAIFHNYDMSRSWRRKLLGNKIDKVMRSAALVICGNNYLGDRARRAGCRRVEIIPSVIDLERYSVISAQVKEIIVVGWIGSLSSVQYLDIVLPALRKLSLEYRTQLRVIGAELSAPGIDIDCRAWSEESEVREIQDIDIGIMPLADSHWERGKCGYKLIQYMACGVPVVASPVGANCEIVENGVNGYLASSSDDWLSALRRLCADVGMRRAMGALGRIAVERKYCIQGTVIRLAQLFHETATREMD